MITSSGCGNVSSVILCICSLECSASMSNNTITSSIGKQARTPYLYKNYV